MYRKPRRILARTTAPPVMWPIVRRLGAVSLLVVGAVHLREYTDGFAEIDTIGPLFLLNFLAASVIGLGLLAPVERILRPRWGTVLVVLMAIGGVALAATSLAMLEIAEHQPLLGFREPGFHPDMIQLAQGSEVVTVALLGAFLIAQLRRDALGVRPRSVSSRS